MAVCVTHLCLLRHGESIWNEEERFTGWVDVPLSEAGVRQAEEAGRRIAASGVRLDVAYTSALSRAADTLSVVLRFVGPLPVIRSPALNERSYGDLEGLYKEEAAGEYGEGVVMRWRSFKARPPHGESLEDTYRRAVRFFRSAIVTDLAHGRGVLVVAHGNTLRALIAHMEGLSRAQVVGLEVPTGQPLLYEFDPDRKAFTRRPC